MSHYRIAVPPGVGDVYWCLTKLKAYRQQVGAQSVELCVQHAGPKRSLAWAEMVDFVDAASFHPFTPTRMLLEHGIGKVPGCDIGMWPNAIVDRGRPLKEWLPELPLDIGFPIKTMPMGEPRVLVYASSQAINKAWVPNLGPRYWLALIAALTTHIGRVTLIGAPWDNGFSKLLHAKEPPVEFEDLTGQTTLPQVADLLKHARIVVGVISGMTILANHFRTPAIAFYPDAHHPDFPRTWVATDAPYLPILSSEAPPPEILAEQAARLARKGKAHA